MNLDDLRIFKTVVDEGGVTRAAEKLLRVQSNVTTRIQRLEADLGTDLFIRERKRLHLAPAGRTLLGYAERLLDLAEEARRAVGDPAPRGPFHLGSMESTAAVRLPGLLTDYFRRHPAVDLRLRTGRPDELTAALLNGDLDAAFVAAPVAERVFESLPAFEEELVIVARRDHPPIGSDRPAPETAIAFETGCPHRERLEAWYARRGEMPRQTIELASYHAILGCVAIGMGVALVPRAVLDIFPQRDLLSEHALPPGQDRATTLLIWRRGVESPNVVALRTLLAERRA